MMGRPTSAGRGSAGWLVVALAGGALVHGTAFARSRPAQCTLRKDGPTSITEVTVRTGSPAGRLTLVVTTSVLLGGDSSVTMSASLGKRAVIRSTFAHSGTTTRSTMDLGLGFKGVRHVELVTTDGAQLAGEIDGRAVTVSRAAGNVDSVVFDDGAPAPKLKTKRSIVHALAKAKKALQSASCPGVSPAPAEVPVAANAIFDSCDRCKLGCQFDPTKAGLFCVGNAFLSAVSCGASPVITPVLCVVSFELNGLSCTNGLIDCEQLCEKSDDCCKVHCPGAVGLCCNGDGEVCCGQNGPSGGTCCTTRCGPNDADGVCCGHRNGDPNSAAEQCVNPALSLCCEPDGTVCGGTDCCPPGWTCCGDHYCAPPGHECCSDPSVPSSTPNFFCGEGQRCVDPRTNLCCAPDAGPECGSGTLCCNGAQLCGSDQTCCSVLDLCGSACCPSHVCVNGSECCADAAHVCGRHCCSGFQQCCNGQCCAGICIGGAVCCPSLNRVCGNTCCQEGYACTDETHGVCAPCPAGGEGCPPSSGDPMCCPSASQCCSNGQCCPADETCCGTPPGCHPGYECIH